MQHLRRHVRTGFVIAGLALGLAPAALAGAEPATALRLEEATPAVGSDGRLVEHVGFETGAGALTPVLRRGRACPCERTVSYSTALDGQTEIPIRVFRGQGPGVAESKSLGALEVRGVTPAPRGAAHVRVTLRVSGGALEIAARDAKSDRPLPVVRVSPPASN